MAKKSKIARNEQRKLVVVKYATRRQELKRIISSPRTNEIEREEATVELQKQPRNASRCRVVNRCFLTGRPHGYLRKFGLSRIAFRELSLEGQIPGVTKSSW